jgi:hypothetical protein
MAIAIAAVATGCMGTRHASRGSSPTAQTQTQTQPSQGQWQGQGGATADQRGTGMGMMEQCPMTVPGTQAAAEETPDGEAITFTTSSPDAVTELRSRVHAMAEMHNRHHAGGQMGMSGGMQQDEAGQGSAGSTGAGSEPGMGSGSGESRTGSGSSGSGMESGSAGSQGARPMHTSRAVVEDVDGGARVTVTPEDPADLQRLQTAVRSRVERMNASGSCGMGDRTMQQGDGQQEELQPGEQQDRQEQRQQER